MKRVCLLTGASGFLGTAFIKRYADRYQIVAVHNRNAIQFATQEQTFLDPLCPAREIPENEHAVYSMRADISQPQEIERLIGDVVARFGRIDLLINGAATRAISHLLAPGAVDPAELLWRVNVLAPLRFSVGVARFFWSLDPDANVRFNRNIINVSSTAGLFVYPDLGQALYGTSKAALNHLTYHLANDFWDIGIRVNAVAPDTFPGRVATDNVLDMLIKLDTEEVTGQILTLYDHGSEVGSA
jgi:NAD(P)-dependent dehydrogenase (short-subunit alcohol dehydrogenase family)